MLELSAQLSNLLTPHLISSSSSIKYLAPEENKHFNVSSVEEGRAERLMVKEVLGH